MQSCSNVSVSSLRGGKRIPGHPPGVTLPAEFLSYLFITLTVGCGDETECDPNFPGYRSERHLWTRKQGDRTLRQRPAVLVANHCLSFLVCLVTFSLDSAADNGTCPTTILDYSCFCVTFHSLDIPAVCRRHHSGAGSEFLSMLLRVRWQFDILHFGPAVAPSSRVISCRSGARNRFIPNLTPVLHFFLMVDRISLCCSEKLAVVFGLPVWPAMTPDVLMTFKWSNSLLPASLTSLITLKRPEMRVCVCLPPIQNSFKVPFLSACRCFLCFKCR